MKRFREAFFPLFFAGTLFIGAEIFRLAELFKYYITPWTDLFLTHAYLSLVVAALCAGVTLLLLLFLTTLKGPIQRFRAITWLTWVPDGFAFVAIVTIFLHLFRLLTSSFLPVLKSVSPMHWIAYTAVGAALLFAVRPRQLREWLQDLGAPLTALGGLILATSVLVVSWHVGAASLERAAVTGTTTGAKPNVILIMMDSLTSRDMSVYGYHLPTTPNLDRLAKEWTVFDNFHANATATVASRAALMTGRYPFTHEWYRYGDLARRDERWTAIPKVLKESGYSTALVEWVYHPAMHHMQAYYDDVYMPADSERPIVGWLGRLTRHIPARTEMLLTYTVQDYTGRAATPARDSEWDMAKRLLSQEHSTPLFLHLNTDRPHYPYVSDNAGAFLPKTEGFLDNQSQQPFLDQLYQVSDQPKIDKLRLRYDETIQVADSLLGEFVDDLKAHGLYDNALIIVTGDHGDNFTKGNQGHRTYLMGAMEHQVPLLIKFPYQREGKRVQELAQTVDILPTILDTLGLPYEEMVDGLSLARPLAPTRIGFVYRPDQWHPQGQTASAAIYGQSKFVSSLGATFLFDLKADPDEKSNRVTDNAVLAARLQEALLAFEGRKVFLNQSQGNPTGAPALPRTLKPPQTESAPVRSYAGAELTWQNADPGIQAWSGGRLHFTGEAGRSYTEIAVEPGATHLVTRYTTAPSVSTVLYVEARDSLGTRLEFSAHTVDRRLGVDGNWEIITPLPEGTASAVVTFKSAYEPNPAELCDVTFDQYAIRNVVTLHSVSGRELQWQNASSGFGEVMTDGRLRFGGEGSRSYTLLETDPETTHLLIRFDASAEASIVNYVDATDSSGNRLDFLITFFKGTLNSNEGREILVALPEGTAKAQVVFKSEREGDINQISNLTLEQIKIEAVTAFQ